MLGQGKVIDGRYEMEELLGEGGLAQVWRVRHVDLGSRYALKVLLFAKKPRLADRLILEGRIQAQLRHPNIVHVHDVIREDGRVALLMEFIDGESLEEFLHHHGRLDVDRSLELMAGVLAGVRAAHEKGVTHRDIKPANILLARTQKGMIPKVTDFGIAKVMEGESDVGHTRVGAVMGTPGYLAPEQAMDASGVDQRADVFALGAILYELIGGTRAFDIDDVETTGSHQPASLDSLAPTTPAHVVHAVHCALSVDPARRFDSCGSMAEALFVDRPALLDIVMADHRQGGGLEQVLQLSLPTGGGGAQQNVAGPTIAPRADRPEVTAGGNLSDPGFEDESFRWMVLALVGLLVLMAIALARRPEAPTPVTAVVPPAPDAEVQVEPAPVPPAEDPEPVDDDGASVDEAGEPGLDQPDEGLGDVTVPVPERAAPSQAAPPAEEPTTTTPPPPAGEAAPADPTTDPAADDAAPDDGAVPEEDAVAMVESPSRPAPEPTPAPAPPPVVWPDVRGTWSGQAAGRPSTLIVSSQAQGRLAIELVFYLGPTERRHILDGTLRPDGSFSARERSGDLTLSGTMRDQTLAGQYRRDGQDKSFPISLTWSSR